MKYALILTAICISLTACNSTPEVIINDELPTVSQASPPSTPNEPSSEKSTENNPQVEPTEDKGSPLAPETPSTISESSLPAPSPEATAASESSIATLSEGSFQDSAHKVSGQAQILQVSAEKILRLEDFKTENGPQLHLYLVKDPTGGDSKGFIDLGPLKGVAGNQNYTLASDVAIGEYNAVTVWCKPFGVNFGFAKLTHN